MQCNKHMATDIRLESTVSGKRVTTSRVTQLWVMHNFFCLSVIAKMWANRFECEYKYLCSLSTSLPSNNLNCFFFVHFEMRQWATQPKVIWQWWGWAERVFCFPGNLHSCMSRWHRSLLGNIWEPPFHWGNNSQHQVLERAAEKIIQAAACLWTDTDCKLIVTCWQLNLKKYLTLFGGVLLSALNALREHFRALCLKAFPSLFSVWSLTLPQVTNL